MPFSALPILYTLSLCFGASALGAAQNSRPGHDAIAGCYRLEVGDWTPQLTPGDVDHLLPTLVRLDTTAAASGGKTLSPSIAYRPSGLKFPGFPRWDIRGDTVEMAWSNGFTPTVVRLSKAGGKFEGYAEARSDIALPPGVSWPRAPVAARRAECPQSPRHTIITPAQLQWRPMPTLPPGAEVAIIEGPITEAVPFIIQLRLPANYVIPAHWHPWVEHATVISGSLNMGMGGKLDRSGTTRLTAGSVAVIPANMNHFSWTSEKAVVQVHGIGPLVIHYVNPADDPRTRPSAPRR
jgi:hypothetical protein